MNGIQMKLAALMVVLFGACAWGAPMTPVARTVIPSDVRQIISIDYSMARNFDLAMELKSQALPYNLMRFETALKEVQVYPDKDVASIVFAAFNNGQQGSGMVAVVSGLFSPKTILPEFSQRQIKPAKYHDSNVYFLEPTFGMTFLDDNTLLMGDDGALRTALSVRDHRVTNVDSNAQMREMVTSVEKATVWSVLDPQASQNMLMSAIGEAGKVLDFGSLKQQVLGSYYKMNFRYGIKSDVVVLTPDRATATKLMSLLKAGVLYKKVVASPEQRDALNNIKMTASRLAPSGSKPAASDLSFLRIEFNADQDQLKSLLQSGCFTAMSNERKELIGVTSGNPAEVVDRDPRMRDDD